MIASAWPLPYPQAYSQFPNALSAITVPSNRADPFFERDGTGWQLVTLMNGRAAVYYNSYNNAPRKVAINPLTGDPEDLQYQANGLHGPAQDHY